MVVKDPLFRFLNFLMVLVQHESNGVQPVAELFGFLKAIEPSFELVLIVAAYKELELLGLE